MRWVRSNAGWIGLALALAGSIAGLYARAALADTDKRVTVLEVLRVEDAKDLDDIKQKVTRIHDWMMEDRRARGE
jgi:hypothetical protein